MKVTEILKDRHSQGQGTNYHVLKNISRDNCAPACHRKVL